MTNNERLYKELVRYGEIVSDRQHETMDGHYIRFTVFNHKDTLYITTMYDGTVVQIAEKDAVKELR